MEYADVLKAVGHQHRFVFEEACQTYGPGMAMVGLVVFVAALLAELPPRGRERFFADIHKLLGAET